MRVVAGAMLVALGAACLDSPPTLVDPDIAGDAAGGGDGAAAADGAPCVGGAWGAPEKVGGLSGVLVSAPTVSGDGELLIYDAGPDLAAATWNGATFVPVGGALVGPLSSAEDEDGPSLSKDGLTLWFLRAGLLRVAVRTAGNDFEEDQPVAGLAETAMLGPEMLEEEGDLSLFFSPTGDAADSIFLSRCSDPFTCGSPSQVAELDEAGNERFPTLSRDGGEIIFRSSAVPGLVSYRRAGPGEPFEQRGQVGVDALHPELALGDSALFVVIDDELYTMTRACQ
jgi:hypothetical protein